MSFSHPPVACAVLLFGDAPASVVDPPKITDWIQSCASLLELPLTLGAAIAAVAAAIFTYRTLCQMRKTSHEEAVRKARAQTLRDLEKATKMAYECELALKGFAKDLQRKAERKQQIEKSLNQWEGVAVGVAAGVYDDQLVYDLVGKFIQDYYRQISWVVREGRLKHPLYFDEVEGLIEKINELEGARYEIDEPAIKRLRQLYVPKEVLELLDSLSRERYAQKNGDKQKTKGDSQKTSRRCLLWEVTLKLLRFAPLSYRFRTLPLRYDDRESFQSDLDQHARAHGAWIDFYKPTIFREARAKLQPILRVTKERCEDLPDEQKERLHEALDVIMKQIHVYTDGKYPTKRTHEIERWVKDEAGHTTCRFLALTNGQDLGSRKLKIVGHAALEDLERSTRWKSEFGQVMRQSRLPDSQQDTWKPESFFLIRELYVDNTDRTRADSGLLLYRRLLRRAIEAVEERHHHLDRKKRKWPLFAVARPANKTDAKKFKEDEEKFEAQTKVIKEEGGVCVCHCAEVGDKRLCVDVYVFGWAQDSKAPSGPASTFGEGEGI